MHLSFSLKRTHNCSSILFPTLLSLSQYKLKSNCFTGLPFSLLFTKFSSDWDSKGSAFSLGPFHSPGVIMRECVWIKKTREFQPGREQHPMRSKYHWVPKTGGCRQPTRYKGSPSTYLLTCCKGSSFFFLIAAMLKQKFVFTK